MDRRPLHREKIKLIKPVMELKQLDDLKKTKLNDCSIAIFYFSNKEIDSNSMITHSLFGYEEGDAYEMIFSNGTYLEEESIDVFKDVLSIQIKETKNIWIRLIVAVQMVFVGKCLI